MNREFLLFVELYQRKIIQKGGVILNEFTIIPKVNETQEFIEIANDFSNPLDIVREAISNSFDAKATVIHIEFDILQEYGERILQIRLKDNGTGMDVEGLQSFFDLGNSLRRNDPNTIGEKGHGTKVYFNSSYIEVTTTNNGKTLNARVVEPYKTLFERQIPVVMVKQEETPNIPNGTEIVIKGYHKNRRDKFTHEILRDYIMWFTKMGSIEKEFNIYDNENVTLFLKGLNRCDAEEIKFGHFFPEESESVQKLFDKHLIKAPDYYCKKVVKQGQLKNFPEIRYDAVFAIEGNRVKYSYNPMLRRSGYTAPAGSYTVQERYGIWLCKDFIPIQRKNEWITYKGSEFTKFHAFINCQDLRLTANRSSVDNTPSEIIEDLREVVRQIFAEIVEGDDWRELSWLEEEAEAYRTSEKEAKDFKWRISKVNKANIATHKGVTLIEPQRESGVFALVVQLSLLEPGLFPFEIIDYDTHSGIDVIVKGDHSTPLNQSKLFYVEFKHVLGQQFNHSFENLHSIVCWDTQIKHDDIVIDINKEERKMIISPPNGPEDYTRYFLDNPRKAHKIEVYVLKDFLKEKLQLNFRPRSSGAVVKR
jgi:hypothetical protein